FGENHSLLHRNICGGCFCGIGLMFIWMTGGTHLHLIGEFLGTSCHAIGFHPIIETIQTKKSNFIKNENNENSNS
ncbi:MAG: hypothetical protein V4506_14510, partial [Bacteroidota bacterium]